MIPRSSLDTTKLHAQHDVVTYEGVSVRYLKELKQALLSNKVCGDVVIYRALEQLSSSVFPGMTVVVSEPMDGSRFMGKGIFSDDVVEVAMSAVEAKQREEWTMEDVCMLHVLPEAHKYGVFGVDLLRRSDVGEDFEGAFLSQARKTPFAAVVGGLEEYLSDASRMTKFVWLDLFSANQPLLQHGGSDNSAEFETMLAKGLHAAIAKFDSCLLFFDSWEDPSPLRRMWCVWEVYGVVSSGRKIKLVFAPGETDKYLAALRRGYQEVVEKLSYIDMAGAECFNPADKEKITKAVISELGDDGFTVLNATVLAALRRALSEVTLAALADYEKSSGLEKPSKRNSLVKSLLGLGGARASSPAEQLREQLREHQQLLFQAGMLMKEYAQYEQATDVFERAQAAAMRMKGDTRALRGECVHGEAAVMIEVGEDLAGALTKLKEAEKLVTAGEGKSSMRLAKVLHDRAWVLTKLRDGKALALMTRALEMKIANGGERQLTVTKSLNGIANIHFNKQNDALALDFYQRTVEIKRELVGDRHPSVGLGLINIASTLELLHRVADGVPYAEEALTLFTSAYGADHPHTQRAASIVHRFKVELEQGSG